MTLIADAYNEIYQGDRAHALAIKAVYPSAVGGGIFPLAGASAVFSLIDTENAAAAPVVDAQACTITEATGLVAYAWQVGDTDTPGDYIAEFVVTLATGEPATYRSRLRILSTAIPA